MTLRHVLTDKWIETHLAPIGGQYLALTRPIRSAFCTPLPRTVFASALPWNSTAFAQSAPPPTQQKNSQTSFFRLMLFLLAY